MNWKRSPTSVGLGYQDSAAASRVVEKAPSDLSRYQPDREVWTGTVRVALTGLSL